MAEKKTSAPKPEKAENSIKQLLDPNDASNITLYDEEDNAVEFEQIALIPHQKKVYAILKPAERMEGIADDEAIAFAVEEDEEGDQLLVVVEDEPIIDEVFKAYHKLLEDEGKKGKGSTGKK